MDFSIMMYWQDITYLLQKLAKLIKKLLKLNKLVLKSKAAAVFVSSLFLCKEPPQPRRFFFELRRKS